MKRYYIFVFLCLLLAILFLNLSSEVNASVNADDLKTYTNQALSNYFKNNPGDLNNASSKMWVIYRWVNSSAYETNKEELTSWLSNYNNIVVRGFNNTSNHSVSIYGLSNTTIFNLNNTSLVNSSNTSYVDYKINSQEYNDLTNWNTSHTTTLVTKRSNSIIGYTNDTLMFFENNFNSNNNLYYGYNYSSFINAHNINFTGNNYVADVKVGEGYNLNNITYKLYFLSDNTKIYNTGFSWQVFYQDGIQGKVGELSIINISKIKSNNYYLEMYNSGDLLCTSNQFSITYDSTGEITNTSGENTGIIDLSGISSGIDNVNNSINQQGENITAAINNLVSGDIERDNFWRSTYDKLFAMNSGDTNEIVMLIESYFPSGDMNPLTIYDTIFGSYTNEPDDFIIRWDDHPLNITWKNGEVLYSGDFIKAGSMNFSAYCRDYDVLRLIKFWLNTFLTFFLLFGYYKLLYKCFIDILGAVSEDIEPEDPPHRPIGFGRG